jgi:hypothetical protein
MAHATDPPPAQDAFTHLIVHRQTECEPARLAWAIRAARSWLGPEIAEAPTGMHRHEADLRLRVSDRPSLVTFHKAAFVDLGQVEPLNGDWQVEIGWRASTLAPLFPVFSGSVVTHGHDLTLSGFYAPPGGVLGRAADRALLHIAAQGTARWFLGELEKAARPA